jgi:hypothetical protein
MMRVEETRAALAVARSLSLRNARRAIVANAAELAVEVGRLCWTRAKAATKIVRVAGFEP